MQLIAIECDWPVTEAATQQLIQPVHFRYLTELAVQHAKMTKNTAVLAVKFSRNQENVVSQHFSA